MQDPIRGMAAEDLGAEHAAQQGHQQTGGHALTHHITHNQRPASLLAAPAQQLRAGGDEVVVVAAHLESWAAASRQLQPLDHGTVIR